MEESKEWIGEIEGEWRREKEREGGIGREKEREKENGLGDRRGMG